MSVFEGNAVRTPPLSGAGGGGQRHAQSPSLSRQTPSAKGAGGHAFRMRSDRTHSRASASAAPVRCAIAGAVARPAAHTGRVGGGGHGLR